jgi:chromosome segregation ATPase
MQTQLQTRLSNLKSEFEAGQKQLSDLESKTTNLRNTLLRISGAIQVLEEELAKTENVEEKLEEAIPVA